MFIVLVPFSESSNNIAIAINILMTLIVYFMQIMHEHFLFTLSEMKMYNKH